MRFLEIALENKTWDSENIIRVLKQLVTQFFELFPDFWHYIVVDVEHNPITLGKLITGLIFIVLGYNFIRFTVSYFERRVLARLDIAIPQRYTIKVLLFYFLLIVLFLFTLYLVEVPLTVFTFVGGAIALGIGFGSRNIMNNFISGLVIVIEHPIRVGDLIEANDLIGVVDHIGFRATRVQSVNNTHIIVPNSTFLETNILNWTLSDKVVRCEVKVGVVYGSPARKVEEFLLKVAEENDRILSYNKNQKPFVLLSNFGASSLDFTLSFWIAIKTPMDLRTVTSDIRFAIDTCFSENGITIAFPQREIHIRDPIPVQMIPPKQS